jgi:hypothetical protein
MNINIISITANKLMPDLSAFKTLRIYKTMTFGNIINNIVCNRVMKFKFFVANASSLYKYSSYFVGKGFTNYCINNTFCRMLTAGNTI